MGSEHFWKLSFAKFAPRLRARAIWKSKSLKRGRFGALLEVELRKICTTPARESDLEVKIVKNWRSRDVFWRSKWFSRGRRRDFDTLQNTWQAQEFVRVAKTLAGVVGWKRVWNERCVSRGRRRDFVLCDVDVWSLRRRIRGKVRGFLVSRKYYFAGIISRGSYRSSYASAQFFRGRRNTFEASTKKSVKRIGILRSSVRSTCHFWRKSRRNASFLSFKASFLKEISQKSFVFELQSFNFEGNLAEKLRLTKSFESHISWQPNHLNIKSFDNQLIWISNRLTTESFESQIDWQPNHLNLKSIDNQLIWISNRLTTKSLESQINWQPHHLKFKSTDNQNHLKHTSIDNQIIWISNQLTTKSIESQVNWQPKSFEPQIRWQPNHLTLNSFESDINWLSNQLNSAHSLPIGSLSLETSATALCGRYVTCNIGSYLYRKGILRSQATSRHHGMCTSSESRSKVPINLSLWSVVNHTIALAALIFRAQFKRTFHFPFSNSPSRCWPWSDPNTSGATHLTNKSTETNSKALRPHKCAAIRPEALGMTRHGETSP